MCIVYELSFQNYRYDEYPTLENCLFVVVKLTKNANTDKYEYAGYGTGFDRKGTFSYPTVGFDCSA